MCIWQQHSWLQSYVQNKSLYTEKLKTLKGIK